MSFFIHKHGKNCVGCVYFPVKKNKPLKSISFHIFFISFQTFEHFNLHILLNLNSLFTQILFNYITCYNANNVTSKALSVAEITYNIHWYKLPVKKQRFVQMMIRRAQKPFYLKGYDIVECSLSTFLKVNLIRQASGSIVLLAFVLFRLFCSLLRRLFRFILCLNRLTMTKKERMMYWQLRGTQRTSTCGRRFG